MITDESAHNRTLILSDLNYLIPISETYNQKRKKAKTNTKQAYYAKKLSKNNNLIYKLLKELKKYPEPVSTATPPDSESPSSTTSEIKTTTISI